MDALPISSVHRNAYLYPTGFLFVHGFTNFRHFTLEKNGGVCLPYDRGVNRIKYASYGHIHFLSKNAGLILE